jgi:hypothetical protein
VSCQQQSPRGQMPSKVCDHVLACNVTVFVVASLHVTLTSRRHECLREACLM